MSERKLRKAAVITAALILILFLIPVKINYNDGGTVQYKAALYTVVKWNRISDIEDEKLSKHLGLFVSRQLKGHRRALENRTEKERGMNYEQH